MQQESTTGSVSSERVKMTLTLLVKKLEYDHDASMIHIAGVNIEDNKFVRHGAHHTLDLAVGRAFTIMKEDGGWDVVALERLEEACDPASRADLAAVVMQEGLAHVCLITPNTTIVRAKLELAVPRKRRGVHEQAHERGMGRFFAQVLSALARNVDFDKVKAVLVASPGFIREQFMRYVRAEVQKGSAEYKSLGENLSKFVLAHSSSGFKHSLREVLQSEEVRARLIDTKAAREVAALDRFFTVLHDNEDQACYGYKFVTKALATGAVETLLLSDNLFRHRETKTRLQYVKLVEDAREAGATVHIFSSMHVSGEQLQQLTGCAAILRYPVPELNVHSEEDVESNSETETSSSDSFEDPDASEAAVASAATTGSRNKAVAGATRQVGASAAATAKAKPVPKPKAQVKKPLKPARKVSESVQRRQEDEDEDDYDDFDDDRYADYDDMADDLGF